MLLRHSVLQHRKLRHDYLLILLQSVDEPACCHITCICDKTSGRISSIISCFNFLWRSCMSFKTLIQISLYGMGGRSSFIFFTTSQTYGPFSCSRSYNKVFKVSCINGIHKSFYSFHIKLPVSKVDLILLLCMLE